MRKFLILYGVIVFSIMIVLGLAFVFWDRAIDLPISTTLVTITYTMFGFSLTSFSIILSFANKSDRVSVVFNKGYNLSIVFTLLTLFIYSNASLLFVVFECHIGVTIAFFIGSSLLIAYYIYFIAALVYHHKK